MGALSITASLRLSYSPIWGPRRLAAPVLAVLSVFFPLVLTSSFPYLPTPFSPCFRQRCQVDIYGSTDLFLNEYRMLLAGQFWAGSVF